MRVSDEYIQVTPRIDGEYRGTIDTTLTGSVVLTLSPETTTGGLLDHAYPYTLDVYDSFDESIIQTGVLISNNYYVIPLNYTKKVGSYRFALTDRLGRTGEATLTVTSGPLSRATFTPVSSVLVSGSDSLGVLRLTDKLGNLLTPELHTIKINAR